MKKIAFFNPFSGISGDMTLGACVDAGMDFNKLAESIAKLNIDDYRLDHEKINSKGISATRVIVETSESHHHRGLPQIEKIITESGLADEIKKNALDVFRTLAQAEAEVHDMPIEEVHFHEVGALDSIIDIVGACVCFHELEIDEIHSSSVALGGGTVKCAHGLLPVPAPATARLIEGIESHGGPVDRELTTPSGAAILKALGSGFGPMPPMRVLSQGYGAGSMELEHPNVLPLIIGESDTPKGHYEKIIVIETSIDDMTAEAIGALTEKLLSEGAKDVYTTPLMMKKNRPGTLLTILCDNKTSTELGNTLLSESSTRGYRIRTENRYCLEYSIHEVTTRFGIVRFKVSFIDHTSKKIKPEYDDVKRIAFETKRPFSDINHEITQDGLDKLRNID